MAGLGERRVPGGGDVGRRASSSASRCSSSASCSSCSRYSPSQRSSASRRERHCSRASRCSASFRQYNGAVSIVWSPLLVKVVEKVEHADGQHKNVFLDSVRRRWMSQLGAFDAAVQSVGH
ncbi:unnamed protein product [Triticum turgidum subsp. durum]|uniref:Trichome birefringence-like C-terminal domain-containing protein n=1 Tax=Triticum turgidum subsp. durum TaxID=4567 RepID=A0A9R1S5H4_TRITD|nr:unnamed protein product [Triticum turgidum subsp. durum]